MSRHFSILHLNVGLTAAALAYGCASSGTDSSGSGGTGGSVGSGLAGHGAVGGTVGSGGTGGSSGSAGSGGTASPGGSGGTLGSGGSAGTVGRGGAGAGGMSGTSGAGRSNGAGAGGMSAGGSSTGGRSAGGAGAGGRSAGGSSGANTGGLGGAHAGGAGAGGSSGTGSGGKAGGGGTGGASTGMSAGCGKAPTIPSSQYNNGKPISITAANMQRRYILSVPANYDNTHPYRFVISFHQRDGNDIQNYSWQYYGLLPLSKDSTIFVAPNGQLNGAPCAGTGNGETSCGWPNPNNSDIALADAVVAQIEENFCVDTNRIFATGWSFGGAMSYETACARPLGEANGYIRGVAVYSGSPQITSGPCPPKQQVAYYASHGTQDNVLQYSGGLSMAQDFAKINGCTWATPPQASGSHICTNITGCAAGYPVEFCSFVGPHTPYPDTGSSNGSWGPGEAWKFLSQF